MARPRPAAEGISQVRVHSMTQRTSIGDPNPFGGDRDDSPRVGRRPCPSRRELIRIDTHSQLRSVVQLLVHRHFRVGGFGLTQAQLAPELVLKGG